MSLEVELKFPLHDAEQVCITLTALGAVPHATVRQSDWYFNHPSRDFAQTDEAFRIRSIGDSNCVTYKGPLLDASTKTRQEIELGFAEGIGSAEQMAEILEKLSFKRVCRVEKNRTPWQLVWQGRPFEAAIDNVDGLGMFIELETIVDEGDLAPARDAILALAKTLGLTAPAERRSYLRLLLESQTSTGNS